MFMGDKVEEAIRQQEREQAQNAKARSPEIFLMDGTDIQIVFLDDKELCGLWRYFHNNRYYTRPEPENDMFVKYGIDVRATFHQVYEVVNLSGYTDRKGVLHPEPQIRFLVATSNDIRTRLKKMADKRNGGSLQNVVANLTVEGSGKGRVVNFDFEEIYEGDPLTAKGAKLERRGRKGIVEFYSPPSVEDQKLILGL